MYDWKLNDDRVFIIIYSDTKALPNSNDIIFVYSRHVETVCLLERKG